MTIDLGFAWLTLPSGREVSVREYAYVPEAKLIEYLLSETHPVGRWKARFFSVADFGKTNVP
jgi:hypothetical protein